MVIWGKCVEKDHQADTMPNKNACLKSSSRRSSHPRSRSSTSRKSPGSSKSVELNIRVMEEKAKLDESLALKLFVMKKQMTKKGEEKGKLIFQKIVAKTKSRAKLCGKSEVGHKKVRLKIEDAQARDTLKIKIITCGEDKI